MENEELRTDQLSSKQFNNKQPSNRDKYEKVEHEAPFYCRSCCFKTLFTIYILFNIIIFFIIMIVSSLLFHYITSYDSFQERIFKVIPEAKEKAEDVVFKRIFNAFLPTLRGILIRLALFCALLIVINMMFIVALFTENYLLYYITVGLYFVLIFICIIGFFLGFNLTIGDLIRLALNRLFENFQCDTCKPIYINEYNASLLFDFDALGQDNNTFAGFHNQLLLAMFSWQCCGYDSYVDLNMKNKPSIYCCHYPDYKKKLRGTLDCTYESINPGCRSYFGKYIPEQFDDAIGSFKYLYLVIFVLSLPILIFIIVNLITKLCC